MNNLSCVILEEKSCNDLSFSHSLIIDVFRLVWADSPLKHSQNLEIIVLVSLELPLLKQDLFLFSNKLQLVSDLKLKRSFSSLF